MKSGPQVPDTGRRLGVLLLAYQVIALLVIVLAPFQFGPASGTMPQLLGPHEGLLADLTLNVVLFLPAGFLLHRLLRGRLGILAVLGLGALASFAIEWTQLFLPGRYSSWTDVLANGLGAGIGAWGSSLFRRWVGDGAGLVGRLFLDLPLVGFTWLMVPACWSLALGGSAGVPATLSASVAVAFALTAAARSTSVPERPIGLRLWLLFLAWSAVALLPLAARAPRLLLVAVPAGLCVLPLADLLLRAMQRIERRVEPRAVWMTALLLLPLLVATTFPGMVPGLAAGKGAAQQAILRWLGAFLATTVLGYLLAEARGRTDRGWPAIATPPIVVAMLLAGFGSRGDAPFRAALPAAISAALGALLFERQRAHVVALRLARSGSGESM